MADMDSVLPYVLVTKKSWGEKSSPLLREGICSRIIRVDVVFKEGRGFEKGDLFRWELLSEVSEDFCLQVLGLVYGFLLSFVCCACIVCHDVDYYVIVLFVCCASYFVVCLM